MNKQLTSEDKKNLDKWILFLIHRIENEKITKAEILTTLKEMRKYFFKNHD